MSWTKAGVGGKKWGWGMREACSPAKELGFDVVLGPGMRTWAWRGVLRRELRPRERMEEPRTIGRVDSKKAMGSLGLQGRDHILGRSPEPWKRASSGKGHLFSSFLEAGNPWLGRGLWLLPLVGC